jgi:hypothetical protein
MIGGKMLRHKIRPEKVRTSVIILAIILLFGVLSMAYGYFQHNMVFIYLGLSISVATSYTLIFKIITKQITAT